MISALNTSTRELSLRNASKHSKQSTSGYQNSVWKPATNDSKETFITGQRRLGNDPRHIHVDNLLRDMHNSYHEKSYTLNCRRRPYHVNSTKSRRSILFLNSEPEQ